MDSKLLQGKFSILYNLLIFKGEKKDFLTFLQLFPRTIDNLMLSFTFRPKHDLFLSPLHLIQDKKEKCIDGPQ